jgi:peptidoglycan/LPS O-acetylase OafA/YrhL
MRKRRHWLRGILGGILFGLGLAILSIVLAFNALGAATPWILLLLGIILGIVLIFVPSPGAMRRRRAGPPATSA